MDLMMGERGEPGADSVSRRVLKGEKTEWPNDRTKLKVQHLHLATTGGEYLQEGDHEGQSATLNTDVERLDCQAHQVPWSVRFWRLWRCGSSGGTIVDRKTFCFTASTCHHALCTRMSIACSLASSHTMVRFRSKVASHLNYGPVCTAKFQAMSDHVVLQPPQS